MIEITQQYVVYQSQSVLLQLGYEIAQSRSLTKPEILAKIQKATKIRLWLKGLNDSYASRETRERIWYQLMSIGSLNDLPYFPSLTTNTPPDILIGIPGAKGDTGATGATGGGIAFSATNVGMDTVIDSFDTSLSSSAKWTYEIFDGTNKRVETLTGGWLNGTSTDDGGLATTDIGDTSSVTFGTNISGSTVQLIAFVSSGNWTIRGTRELIPVSGNGIALPTALADGTIWIGNSSNQPTSQTISGDVTITDTGVATISASAIVNSKVSATAAIAVNKLAPLTASKAVVSDSSGFLTTSISAASKVDYLANVTSDIQTQINTIAAAGSITGAITTYVTTNATANRAIVSNVLGKLTTSATTDTEIGYVSGVVSSIQTQLNNKLSLSGGTLSGVLNAGANKVTNIATATSASDAVRFDQVNTFILTTNNAVNVTSALTTILTLATTSNKSMYLKVRMIGRWVSGAGSAGDSSFQGYTVGIKNISGTPTFFTTSHDYGQTSTTDSPSSLTFSTSGSNILIRTQTNTSGSIYNCTVFAEYFEAN